LFVIWQTPVSAKGGKANAKKKDLDSEEEEDEEEMMALAKASSKKKTPAKKVNALCFLQLFFNPSSKS